MVMGLQTGDKMSAGPCRQFIKDLKARKGERQSTLLQTNRPERIYTKLLIVSKIRPSFALIEEPLFKVLVLSSFLPNL
jgi:hypothetical protein